MKKIGGQAVIEGVMMRSENKMAIAVRNPEGKIITKTQKLDLLSEKMKKWFFIRGIVNLIEMLSQGIKALNFSADVSLGEDYNTEKKNSWFIFLITVVFGVGIGLFIFKFLPLLVAQWINPSSNILFNIIDGSLKLLIFIAYVYGISLMKDVRRVFEYHGAEHAAVHCYEAKEKLTVKNAKKYSTIHPRCGTSFIMIVILVSVIVYTFIPMGFSFIEKLIYRILLLPIIAGIAFELLKLGAKYENNLFLKFLSRPGLWIQKITTQPPDDEQLEVALVALKKVV